MLQRRRLYPYFAMSLLMLSSATTKAQQMSPAEQAALEAQRGNYAIAYCLWRSLADQGDADALLNLGWMYHNGYGLILDDAQALALWQDAASAGQPEGWLAIGNLYRLGGRGVRRNLGKAAQYLLKATAAGIGDADALARVVLSQLDEDSSGQRLLLLKEYSAVLGGQLEVSVELANFRDQASLNSKILRGLTQGAQLTELNRNGDWVHAAVNDDALVGWIHHSIVRPRPSSPP